MQVPLKYRIARWIGHQHYVLRGRDRIIRIFAAPDCATSIPFSVNFFGHTYGGNLTDFIDWSVYVYGAYSSHELRLLGDIAHELRQQLTNVAFYDVGANVGQHTLFMSKLVDEVISFEPYEPVRSKLLEKLKENKIHNVRVFSVGLGKRNEDLTFFPPARDNMGTGTFHADAEVKSALKLPVRQGDIFFSENGLPRIDLMKVDVEGFESEVFDGLCQRIRRDRPIILTEISGTDRSGFGTLDCFAAAIYDDCEIFAVGCTSISGTYRIKSPSFHIDDEFLVVPSERVRLLKRILTKS